MLETPRELNFRNTEISSFFTDNLEKLESLLPDSAICPITLAIIQKPSRLTTHFHYYEDEILRGAIKQKGVCPLTNAQVTEKNIESNSQVDTLFNRLNNVFDATQKKLQELNQDKINHQDTKILIDQFK